MKEAILNSVALIVCVFALVAIVACGTYLGNMASARALEAEQSAAMESFRQQLDKQDPERLPSLPGDTERNEGQRL